MPFCNRRRLGWLVVLGWVLPAMLGAQAPAMPATGSTSGCLIVPFTNRSGDVRLDWMGESFVQALGSALRSGDRVTVLSRAERRAAFEQAGVPPVTTVSEATLITIAQDAGARWLVTGWYRYDGQHLEAAARLFDLKREHLTGIPMASGALADLLRIQATLARELAAPLGVTLAPSKPADLSVPLPAYESYIRSLLTPNTRIQIRYLRDAVGLAPGFTPAIFRLGEIEAGQGDNDNGALNWLTRVPAGDRHYWQAQFLAGLCAYRLGQDARAAAFFQPLAVHVPLPEVLNNLALSEADRDPQAALDLLVRALRQEPNDSVLQRNRAAVMALTPDRAGALRRLDALRHRGADVIELERRLAERGRADKVAEQALVRRIAKLKTSFPLASYRQLERTILAFDAARAASLSTEKQGLYRLRHGQDLLRRGALDAAQAEFEHAAHDPSLAGRAALGEAQVALARKDWTEAERQAIASIRISPSADAYVVLARAHLGEGRIVAARASLREALRLDPGNADARALEVQLRRR